MKNNPLATAAYFTIFIWGLSEGRSFLLPIFISGFLAFLMAPLHRLLVRKAKVPDALAVVLSAIVFISPLVLFGFVIAQQGRGFVQSAPQLIATGQAKLQNFISSSSLAQDLGIDTESISEKISSSLGQGVEIAVGGVATIAGVGSQMLLIFVFAILFLASRSHLRKSAEHILAQSQGINGPQILDQSVELVQRFLLARMFIVVIIGAMATLALYLLGVSYCVFVGAFFGILTLVPAIGSIIGVGTGAVTAIVTGHSVENTLVIIAILFAISAIENYVLTPKLVGNRLNLAPLTCFIGLFAGGLLWGVWGMFLSIPILGVIRIVFSAIPSLQGWGELLADRDN